MIDTIQLFNGFCTNNLSKPDEFTYDIDSDILIDENFVISRDIKGNTISMYKDDKWDFSSYSNTTRHKKIIYFNTLPDNSIIYAESKRLFFLIMLLGEGVKSSSYSPKTLYTYFYSGIKEIAIFAHSKNITLTQCLSEDKNINEYIDLASNNSSKIKQLKSIISFLLNHGSDITKINVTKNKNILEKLLTMKKKHNSNISQTQLIPSRILSDSLRQRWEHINNIEIHINDLLLFLKEYLCNDFLSHSTVINRNKGMSIITCADKYGLCDLFNKYKIKSKYNFVTFIKNIQGTCKHLIHAYSGMRNEEVLSLKNNCLEKIDDTSLRLIGITTKLEGRSKEVKWVTSKEIERIIKLLNNINSVVIKHYNLEYEHCLLFMTGCYFKKIVPDAKLMTTQHRHFYNTTELPLDENKLRVSAEDLNEINEVNYNKCLSNSHVGDVWVFKSHQYRRSLAVYSLKSGLVSIGALQSQLKHLLKNMTLYYSNGSSFITKYTDTHNEHIANEIKEIKHEINAIAYLKNAILSDEKLFGAHGKFLNQQYDKTSQSYSNILFSKERDETVKLFKNGELSYKETPLGGCVSIDICDSRLLGSMTSCFDCSGAILKKTKIENAIFEQENFINILDKTSIEYRTELEELNKLVELKNKLIKE